MMKLRNLLSIQIIVLGFLFLSDSCNTSDKKKVPEKFKYEKFKDSIQSLHKDNTRQTTNFFDANLFIPGKDSLTPLLKKIDTLWQKDLLKLTTADSLKKNKKSASDSTQLQKAIARYNLKVLDSFLNKKQDTLTKIVCTGLDCFIYVEVIKSSQTLYLYIESELKDSFKVSTGKKNYETPNLNTKPAGPLLIKYTSRKFPGGSYQGLGNMPYVVFIKNGYAIHGTTPGNFKKLGTKASHGCIRLHPDNARLFYELVKLIGIENTWIAVRDSL